jgi:hypothetical protein
MGFAPARFIPATSKVGTDEYLIIGFEGMDAICIDQDGDVRPITYTDLTTKWVYMREPGVWLSNQMELDELVESEETPEEAQE